MMTTRTRHCLLITALMLVASVSLLAAEEETKTTWFGGRVSAGVGILGHEDQARTTLSGGLAWQAGLVALFNSGGFASIGFQPEVLYTSELVDMKFDVGSTTFNLDMTTRFSSIRVPLLVKLSLGDPNTIQPSVFLGPFANILIGAKAENNKNGSSTDIDSLNTVGYGLAVGADLRLLRNLIVDARFYWGLSEYIKSDPLKQKFSSVMVGLHVMFN